MAEKFTVERYGHFLLIFLIALTFVYVSFKDFSPFVRAVVPVATAVAVYKTIKATERAKPRDLENKTWKLVAVCLGIWLAGEISVVAFFLRFGEIPYPSPAEIAYLIGYILLTIGAVTAIRKIDVKLPISHIITFTTVVLLLSIGVTNFVIAKALSGGISLSSLFSAGLPVADMLLIIVVLAIYFVYFGAGKKERLLEDSWSVVILGMTFSAFADIVTTYTKVNLVSSVYVALLPGILYIWSRGVVGMGAGARA